jgi:hypothetical protein
MIGTRGFAHCAVHMSNAGLHTHHTLNPILPNDYYATHQQINRLKRRAFFYGGG